MVARYLSVFICDPFHFLDIQEWFWFLLTILSVYGSPKSIEMTVQF